MPKQTFFNLPDDKRETLINIAIDEFAENEYQKASISRIVARVGIAKGSFYQYFENKEDLYRYLLELGAEEKATFLQTEPPDAQVDIFAYLHWLIKAGIQFELSNPKLSQVGYRALKSNRLPNEMMVQGKENGRLFFTNLVAQGKAQGHIATNIDADLVAFIFNTIFTELGQYLWQRMDGDASQMLSEGNSIFASPEADYLFDQLLHILQFGMGNNK